jgi:hypothetical protein
MILIQISRGADRDSVRAHTAADGASEGSKEGQSQPFGPSEDGGKRRRLLDYLAKKDIERYRACIAKLGIRK